MTKEELIIKLEKIAQEANSSPDPTVNAIAGILITVINTCRNPIHFTELTVIIMDFVKKKISEFNNNNHKLN